MFCPELGLTALYGGGASPGPMVVPDGGVGGG